MKEYAVWLVPILTAAVTMLLAMRYSQKKQSEFQTKQMQLRLDLEEMKQVLEKESHGEALKRFNDLLARLGSN